jgi:hypothetical protein
MTFVAFVVARELSRYFAGSSEWVANLVGLGVWSVVAYIDLRGPNPWRLVLDCLAGPAHRCTPSPAFRIIASDRNSSSQQVAYSKA